MTGSWCLGTMLGGLDGWMALPRLRGGRGGGAAHGRAKSRRAAARLWQCTVHKEARIVPRWCQPWTAVARLIVTSSV